MTVPALDMLTEAAGTMTRRWPWVVVTLLCCLVIPSLSSGAMSGKEWRGLSDFNRSTYVAGVLDGWQAIQLTLPSGAGRYQFDQFGRLPACAVGNGMATGQTNAIVEKYMKDHPDEWQLSMPFLIVKAMNSACHD
jgi:Ssp1 endopeptidase immunity protein Rap1a